MDQCIDRLSVTVESPRSAVALALVRDLSAEISALYGGSGHGNFNPSDVECDRAAFFVAWLAGEPVGCGALRPLDPTTPVTGAGASGSGIGEVKRMYVAPGCRGRGVAAALLSRIEETARAFGYAALWLETGERQHAAIRLYERHGYRRTANYGPYVGLARNLCFAKSLSPQAEPTRLSS